MEAGLGASLPGQHAGGDHLCVLPPFRSHLEYNRDVFDGSALRILYLGDQLRGALVVWAASGATEATYQLRS